MRVPTLTQNNYFKFGYDNNWFELRQNEQQKFTAHFDRCQRAPLDWKTETLNAARVIRDSTDLPIHVMFSGGIDSEVAVQAFMLAGIPFTAAILRFNYGLNDHDIHYATKFCEQKAVPYQYYDLDVRRFFESGDLERYADETLACSSHQCVTMWLADQIQGYPVIGQGEAYVSRIDHWATRAVMQAKGKPFENPEDEDWRLADSWSLRERERMAAWYRFFIVRQRDAAPGFHQYTPEQFLSFLVDPAVTSVIRRNFKYSTQTSKSIIYRTHFELEDRPKFTGFEQLGDLSNRWAPILGDKPLHCDDMALFPYDELVRDLAPIGWSPPAENPTDPVIIAPTVDGSKQGIHRVLFDEAKPLLAKLWPDKNPLKPYDNTLNRIKIPLAQREALIQPVFLNHYIDGIPVGTTHAYRTGGHELRIRGTYVEPEYRRTSIARDLVLDVFKYFPDCEIAYTFPRVGAESFYVNLGFRITGGPHAIYKGLYEAERPIWA